MASGQWSAIVKKILTTFFAIAAIAAGCVSSIQHPAIHAPNDTPQCADACVHLRTLKCAEGNPLPNGTTCEQFCQSTQQSGHALILSCVMRINNCSEMDSLDALCPTGVQLN